MFIDHAAEKADTARLAQTKPARVNAKLQASKITVPFKTPKVSPTDFLFLAG